MSRLSIDIHPLEAGHRHAMQLHLMGLDAADRHARFGCTLSDTALIAWAQGIDWRQDRWWGAWTADAEQGLLGALQLTPTRQSGTWELALTVHPALRRQGVATALLKTAAGAGKGAAVTTLVCENGHPAVPRMARTLGWRVRLQDQSHSVWLDLP